MEEFPAEAAVDRESCRLLGMKSNLTLPLSVGGESPVGALGLNTLREQRDWLDAVGGGSRPVAGPVSVRPASGKA